MGWSTKSLQNNCWRFFVRLSLPPEISMSSLEKTVLWYLVNWGQTYLLKKPQHITTPNQTHAPSLPPPRFVKKNERKEKHSWLSSSSCVCAWLESQWIGRLHNTATQIWLRFPWIDHWTRRPGPLGIALWMGYREWTTGERQFSCQPSLLRHQGLRLLDHWANIYSTD